MHQLQSDRFTDFHRFLIVKLSVPFVALSKAYNYAENFRIVLSCPNKQSVHILTSCVHVFDLFPESLHSSDISVLDG